MAELLLRLDNVGSRQGGQVILAGISLTVKAGQHWVILGASGSGKTTLARVVAGLGYFTGVREWVSRHNERVRFVPQQHQFQNLSHTNDFYYQQRFNAIDAEDTVTVRQYLGFGTPLTPAEESLVEKLVIAAVLDRPLIQLSNGENKRVQIASALLDNPALLVLDNPFTGLDVHGRDILRGIINVVMESGIQVMMVTVAREIPPSFTHAIVLEKGRCVYAGPVSGMDAATVINTGAPESVSLEILEMPAPDTSFEFAIQMRQVSVKYGDKQIIDGLDWEVRRGDCWRISGPNGSGKSTLLSLVTADNPQAYANDIYLFDRKRGSGESIWDIKKRIGYVSPELHLFFERSSTCFEVIASGLFDTIGLFRRLSPEQEQLVSALLTVFDMQHRSADPMFRLSLGEQRMLLLTRAFIKNPPLLILDEPCQGLDEAQGTKIRFWVDSICRAYGTTLLYVSHYEEDLPGCVTRELRLDQNE